MSKTTAEFGMCSISATAYKSKVSIHVKTTVQFYVHTTCRGKCSDSHVCTTSIDTDTPKTTARFDVQHISNRSDVSRVLSLTAAADAHMQSWMAVMLDRKRAKTAVHFDVHISETKTRPCSRLWLPCQKRWSIFACACFSRGKSHYLHARYTCAEVMNGPLVDSRPNAVHVPSFEILKRRR